MAMVELADRLSTAPKLVVLIFRTFHKKSVFSFFIVSQESMLALAIPESGAFGGETGNLHKKSEIQASKIVLNEISCCFLQTCLSNCIAN